MNISSQSAVRKDSQKSNWITKLVAILALINFALVLFDYSYVPWRDFYLQAYPPLTQFYDPVKGIEPHPITEDYLKQFNTLKDVSTERLDIPLITERLDIPLITEELSQLRTISDRLIEDNPFAAIGKSSTLEKIKHELGVRTEQKDSHDAFATFWSQAYLNEAGWRNEINFFDSEIKPLIATNYYRDLGRFSKFVDYFWLIDLPFVIIFALDILIRTYLTSRSISHLSWWSALLRRWYDLFLILPFWRSLRIIPVTVRLYQASLLNLKPLRKQLNYGFIIGFIEEIAELLGIHAIDRVQESIKTGEVAHRLFHPDRRSYVRVNNRNEVKAIAARLFKISVNDVLPQIQPDLETLLHHAIASAIERSPIYQRLQSIPGFKELPAQLSEQLTKELSQTAYNNIAKGVDDPVTARLSDRLLTNFRDALELELQKKHNLREIESLLVDMLEEIKINYVAKIAEGGFEGIVEEADRLRKNPVKYQT